MTPDAPRPRLELDLLGGIALRGLDAAEVDRLLAQPKLVALLAYLAVAGAGGRWQRRDHVVGLLWPELDQSHARGALRKSIHILRTALGSDAIRSRGDEELCLSPEVVGCDVVAFGEDIEHSRLARALERYEGELMPGFHLTGCAEFGQWMDDARSDAREQASAAAWALACRLEEDAEHTKAAKWARRSVRYDRDDERKLRRVLTMLDRLGDRAAALRLYDEFARRLEAEFGAKPSAETEAVVAQLRGTPK